MGNTAAEPADPAMFQDLLLFNVADGDTRRFLEEFDRLAAWVDSSLDMYKVRLKADTPVAENGVCITAFCIHLRLSFHAGTLHRCQNPL